MQISFIRGEGRIGLKDLPYETKLGIKKDLGLIKSSELNHFAMSMKHEGLRGYFRTCYQHRVITRKVKESALLSCLSRLTLSTIRGADPSQSNYLNELGNSFETNSQKE